MKYLPQEIIRIKRNGGQLSADHLSDLSKGITSGEVNNAQIAAFSMAVYFQDLSVQERVDWTKAVVDSGKVLNWKETSVNGPIVDKHSTGGIGDGVSLILAPMLAACGAFVPMIAGRGLAHTGGTIDKLESIPGYMVNTDGNKSQFAAGVQVAGQLQNRFTVYKNPYMTENKILVGFRGSNFLETGAVYSPYVPLIMTPLVYDPSDFTPRKGVMTRYAKKMIRPEFYGTINCKDLNLV